MHFYMPPHLAHPSLSDWTAHAGNEAVSDQPRVFMYGSVTESSIRRRHPCQNLAVSSFFRFVILSFHAVFVAWHGGTRHESESD
jgi:hypothetical protein